MIRSQIQATVCCQDSIEQHNQALSHLQQNLRDDKNGNIQPNLIYCVLIIVFETLLGNYNSARLHLESGLKILYDWQVQQDQSLQSAYSPANSVIEDDLLPVFSILNLQARSLVDSGLSQHHLLILETPPRSRSQMSSQASISRESAYTTYLMPRSILFTLHMTSKSLSTFSRSHPVLRYWNEIISMV